MRLIALAFLIIGNLVASQAHAEDASAQPLTRLDCDKAGMPWDDNANVCGSASAPKPEVTEILSQPLTRSECDKAGMRWKENVNVCGEKPTLLINIDKAKQRMTVLVDGVQRYDWPVSTGKAGYSTPSGTFTPTSMNKVWYSKEWDNAPMPHAIFFMKDGHAIHGSYEVRRLGKAASHGCVRISPQNAVTLYALVDKNGLKNTQVVLAGVTPGGEGKVASSVRPRSHYTNSERKMASAPVGRRYNSSERKVASRPVGRRYSQTASRWSGNTYYAEADASPRERGGFFRRLFGGQ